jgi:prophage regulatory protein
MGGEKMKSNQEIIERVIRIKEVMDRTGLSRSTIYLQVRDGEFPKPINLGSRSVGWLQSEVDSWIAQKIGKRQS